MSAIVFLRNSFLALSLLFLVTKCKPGNDAQRLPYYNTPEFSPMFLSDKAEVQSKITHTIGKFTFVNQDGDTLTEKAIKGKIHIANFIFTSCGNICPVMTDQMARVGKAFENDTSVVILSYTVTPWIDNPARLKKYKADKGIKKSNWYFLTGNKAAIYKLARQSYFAEESLGFTKDSTKFLHTEHFLLVDASQRIRGIYNGTLQLEAEQLIKDIRELKGERLD
jgi:protein SCO1/2